MAQPYSQKEIIDAALRIAAGSSGDPNASPIIDNSVVIEDLFYTAIKQATIEGSAKPDEVGGLKRDFEIPITNGVGTVPDDVIDECMDDSSVYSDDEDFHGLMSFQPRHFDYLRSGHSQLGYYAVQGPTFLFQEPGGDPGTFNGTVHLVAVSVPDLSGAITAAITVTTEVAERTIILLAQMLQGKQPTG